MLKRIYIEISNICNVQCSFCPVVERDNQVLTPVDFEKILIQARPLAEEVCLHLMGEPTAHPQFSEILDLCDKHKVKIQLTTNGLLIERKKEMILEYQSIRQVNFSLQSFKDNFPEKDLMSYMMPIMKFTELAHERRPEVYINYRMWNVGAQNVDNNEIYDVVENYFKIEINRNVQVEHIKSKRIWNKLYLHFDSRFEWPELAGEVLSQKGTCHGLRSHIGIHANGSVVPCCLDKEAVINLGNVFETSLDNILKSERAKKMRDGFNQGILREDLCQRCDYVQRFNKN